MVSKLEGERDRRTSKSPVVRLGESRGGYDSGWETAKRSKSNKRIKARVSKIITSHITKKGGNARNHPLAGAGGENWRDLK